MDSSDNGYEALRREYAATAARYDARWRRYVGASIQGTLRRLDVGPGDRVLDVGCGTGALLEALAAGSPRADLAGVDLSREMLGVARRKLGPGIDLGQARAEALPFRDAAFDVVVSTSVLHFVREPSAVLREMHRVLGPSGRLVITDWCDDYVACRLCGMLLRALGRAHFHIYRSGECRALLSEAGFADIDVQRYRISWLWGLMTASAVKGPASRTARAAGGAAPRSAALTARASSR